MNRKLQHSNALSVPQRYLSVSLRLNNKQIILYKKAI